MSMNVVIAGASGRMGRVLLEAVAAAPDMRLFAALERSGSPFVGRDAGELVGASQRTAIHEDLDESLAGAHALIDFTRPEATLAHIEACRKHKVALVIGTTGFDEAGKATILAASRDIPIVFAPNMSVGVNLVFKLLDMAAKVLDEGYDIEIVEAHHRHKVDAPSGTALALGKAAAAGRGVELAAVSDRVRDGHTGARLQGHIGFATLRGGDVVGEHSVIFAADGERLELAHKATDRGIFARGAVHAALWAAGKPAGLYSMADVLALD